MAFSTREAAPPLASILGGSTSTNGGTLITVPMGRIWSGTVNLSAYLLWTGGIEGAPVQAGPTITIEGTGSRPSPGSLISHLYLSRFFVDVPASAQTSHKVVIAAATQGSIILRLNFQGASGATGIATGQLL